ncbi:MAG: 16S rRNA (cytosine(1402)-N(4))-methyltransferase RsmH, partial [Neisseriaceae bacterium]|nr:16S rRNA (cytosine(1402)-N(4))-methyltransferase RsmH [Neisseriaceae bacterium]
VIRDYGEEKFYRRIAAKIIASRPVRTTVDLANICRATITKHEKGQHPATRTFQGVRIFINGELEELSAVLPQVAGSLKTGGRLAVIAFHSLEDRIVKQFMKQQSTVKPLPKWVIKKDNELEKPPLKIVGKAIRPLDTEVQNNPRARSAVLRVAERTDGKL